MEKTILQLEHIFQTFDQSKIKQEIFNKNPRAQIKQKNLRPSEQTPLAVDYRVANLFSPKKSQTLSQKMPDSSFKAYRPTHKTCITKHKTDID